MPDVVVGQDAVVCDNEQAMAFVEAWWGVGDNLINLVRMAAHDKKPLSPLCITTSQFINTLKTSSLHNLVYANGIAANLYHSAAFVKEPPKGFKRGGKANVSYSPGIWVDLDVKDGSFADEEHILSFLRKLPILPNVLVGSGSGGMHAYFKSKESLNSVETQILGEQWHSYLVKQSGVVIDKLQNSDRVLRTPGSIYFPKDLTGSEKVVRLIYAGGDTHSINDFRSLSKDAWQEVLDRKKETHRRVSQHTISAGWTAEGLSGWPRLLALSNLEEDVALAVSWDSILLPRGWTFLSEDSEGRRLWARPGSDSKSAVTDWEGSPHTMSLFSDAPETGLSLLKEAEVPLSKYRVLVELNWNGNESEFVKAWLNGEVHV